MDFEYIQPEIDIYEVPEGNTYAAVPAPNNTLTLLAGAEEGNYEEVARSISNQGAAYVAAQKAIKEREEEVSMLWEASRVKAQQGDVLAAEEGIRQLQALNAPVQQQSYLEDTSTVARAALERIAAQSGKNPEEIIRLVDLRSKNLAVKSSLEILIQSMPERSAGVQLFQDVVGATTGEDWALLTPAVNTFAKEWGFEGPKALTKAGATENTLALIRQLPQEEVPKFLLALSDKVTEAVGGKDARRFFEQLNSLMVDSPEVEGLFGVLDVVGITALARGGLKALWRGANTVRVAREVGQEKAVIDDLLSKLTADKSVLGATKAESVEAGIAGSVLSDLRTLSPQVHQELEKRTESLLESLRNTLYTGGATSDEIAATVARLEATYAKEVNPAIVDSARVIPNADQGIVSVDVLYGRHNGKLFDTAEEALAYWKPMKAGNLEAVRLNGSADEIAVEIARLEEQAKKLTVELTATRKGVKVERKVQSPKEVEELNSLRSEREKLIQETSPLHSPGQVREAKKQLNFLEQKRPNISDEFIRSLAKKIQEQRKVSYKTALSEAKKQQARAMQDFMAQQQKLNDFIGDNARAQQVTNRLADVDKRIAEIEKKPTMVSEGVPADLALQAEQKAEQLSEAIANLSLKREQLNAVGLDKWAVRQKVDFPVFTDDLSKMSVDELDRINRTLGVANPRFLSTRSLFQGAVSSMYKTTRMRELFKDFVETSFNPLSTHQKEKVDEALIATDKIKRNLQPLELEAMGLAAKEQEAYYAYRTMRDIQWMLKNEAARKDLVAKGNKFLKVSYDDVTFEGPGKIVSLDAFMGKRFYDVENKKFVTVTPENLRELQTRQVLPMEYAQGQSVVGVKSEITKVLAPVNSTTQGDIRQVVGKVDGSFSRVYTEDYWIKLEGKGLVDDEEINISKAFRTAATEKDAKEYVKGFTELKALRASGKIVSAEDVTAALKGFEKDAKGLADRFNDGDFDKFTIKQNYTRMEDNFIRDVVGTGGGDLTQGRVFWSKRGEEGIKSITNGGTSAETLAPLKSLEAELSNTSNYVATNEWRRNSIQKWFNTFGDILNIRGIRMSSAEDAFFDSVNKMKHGHMGGDARESQMLATRDFILNQMGVLSTQEKATRAIVNKATSFVDGFIDSQKHPALSHIGHFLRRSNVVEWTKGVSSHLMLGSFNIGQLVVQSSGMALAASMHPKHGLKAAMSIRPILVAMTSDNPSVWQKVFKTGNVAKDTGMTLTEFQEVAKAIRKTGLLDNIGASSLYTAEDGALSIYGNKGVEKFKQASMMFFNKGEEINRVAGFEVARRQWIELNPGKKWNTDGALEEILAKADDFTTNMTRATEGSYQKGIVGIPFQFLQHSIKFGANVVGGMLGRGPLTQKEAVSLIAGSVVLFGLPETVEAHLGDYLNGLPPEAKQYITQGLIAGVVSTVGETLTGERTNIALGSRLGQLDFYDNLFFGAVDMLSGEFTKAGQALLGPTGSTLNNLWEIKNIAGDFFGQDEKSLGSFVRTINDMGAQMVSSWKAADKAYWAYHANMTLHNKRGDPVAKLTTPEWVFQALSFQSTEAAESNLVFKTNQSYQRFIKKASDEYIRLRGQAHEAFLAGNIEDMNAKWRQADALIYPLPPGDQQKIWQAVQQRTTYGTVGEEAINKWGTNLTSHKNRLMVTNPYEGSDGN